MATVDELIEQNKLKETALVPAAAEPEGGLLSRIESFIGGSTKPDTLDASGLTQADRRQSLFAGLTDIGAKLMAAGEPMWGHQRAQYLAGLGQVPANMQQMRSGIAQQKLLGIKGLQAQRELQVQREMDVIAKDPNHPMWKEFKGQDLALAQWAMKNGGYKGFLEFYAHRNDAAYKAKMVEKAQAEINEINQGIGVRNQIIQGIGGVGGAQPAVPGQPPPAAAPPGGLAPPVATPTPPEPTGASPPSAYGTGADAGSVLNPQQQVLAANQPPTAQPGGGVAAQGDLPGPGGVIAQGDAVTEGGSQVDPNAPPPPFMGGPAVAQAPPVPGQPQPPVSNQDIPRAPRSLKEIGQVIPPAQLLPIMGLKGNEFFNALEKLVAPGMTPVYDTKTGDLVNVPSNQLYSLDPRRFKPAAAAQQAFQEKKFEYDKGQDAKKLAVEEATADLAAARQGQKRVRQSDGTYKLEDDPQAKDRIVEIEQRKAEADAAAKMIPQERELQARRLDMDRWKAGVKLDPTTQQIVPDEQAQQAQAKIEGLKATETAPIEVHRNTAQQTYKDFLENSRPRALAAVNQIPLIIEAQELVDRGIKTGTFTEFRQFASQFAETLHMSKMSDDEIRTAGFNQVVQKLAVELLQSKALGSGNSITDTDLKFALNMIENSKGNIQIIKRALAHLEGNARRTIDNYGREHDALSQDSYLAPSMKSLSRVEVPDRDKVVTDLNKRWTELNAPATPGMSPEATDAQRRWGPPRRP